MVDIEGDQVPEGYPELLLIYHGDLIGGLFSPFRIIDDTGRIEPGTFNYGIIYIDNDFSQFTIELIPQEEDAKISSEIYMITVPATTREEATRRSEALIQGFNDS